MKRNRFLLLFLLLVWMGCSYALYRAARVGSVYLQNNRELIATRRIDYPWHYYPIDEESKQALCQALQLPANHDMCQQGTEIMFYDVVEVVREVFPEGETPYSTVEEKLGEFPHIEEKADDPSGNLTSFSYVYQLTNYEGACIDFFISLKDLETVERIASSHFDALDGFGPTTCWP